jgi:hypothetical protein
LAERVEVLLLHDHGARELARDLAELLGALQLPTRRIEVSADKGLTLDGKELEYLSSANAVIFLLTPGSERSGALYPSPSVSHEMGQVKQLFKNERARKVIYVVDSRCSLPAIDQKARREFTAGDTGSVIRMCQGVVQDLVAGGILRLGSGSQATARVAQPDDERIWKRLPDTLLALVMKVSEADNQLMSMDSYKHWARWDVKLDASHVNLALQDVQRWGLAQVGQLSFISLTSLGWAVVRRELAARKARASTLFGLATSGGIREPLDWP